MVDQAVDQAKELRTVHKDRQQNIGVFVDGKWVWQKACRRLVQTCDKIFKPRGFLRVFASL